MDKELGSRSLRRRKGGYTEEMKEAIANQDNMSYTQQFKPSGDSGSYRKTQTRDNSSVTPNTTGTTSVIATSKHQLIETKMVFSSLTKTAGGCTRLVTIHFIIHTFVALHRKQI